ncbi:MAG TPA: MFS transporter [Candidatus Dormibacteraeota bacterium]|nr:MFS transporter [Candidatus Dormibacteraeota bacterium]
MAATRPGAQRSRWRILGSALLIQLTISIVTQGFPALAPFAKLDLGLTRPEVGIFATVLNLGTMLALLPAGWAVDILGDRRVLVAGGIATGLVTAVAAFAPSFILLVPLLIIVGLAGATPTPAGSTAIISAFAARDRGFIMSIRQTGIPLGGALAALILPPIAIAAGWRVALLVAGGLAVLGAVVGFLWVSGAPQTRRAPLRRERGSLRAVATRDATFIGLAGIFLTLGQFVLVSYIALYLYESWHLPLAEGSLFLVAANIGGVVGRLAWGTVSDHPFKRHRRGPLILVSLLAAGGFVILAWLPVTTPQYALFPFVFALGATVIGWNGVYITLLSEIAPSDKRGRSVAYGMTISQVGIFGGPVAFGLLVDVSGSYRVGWLCVAAALVVGALLMRQVRERPTRAVDVGVVSAT